MTQEEEEEEEEEEAVKLKDRAEQIKRKKKKKKKKRGRHKVEWFVSDGSNGERRLLINAGVTHTPAFIGLHNMYGYSIQKKNLLSSFFGGEQKMMKKQMISMSSSLPLCPCVCRQTRNKGESTQIISST
jgi:hypothetical protein